MNPYKILDLPESSQVDPVALNAAYKKAASKAHPDRNAGDTSKMTEINQARDILLNPERKKRFDETGSTSSGPPTLEEQAIVILGNIFAEAVDKSDETISSSQIMAFIAQHVAEGLQKAREQRAQLPSKLKRARKIAKSFDCAPVLRKALDVKIAALEQQASFINNQIALGEMMLKQMQSVRWK